MSQTENPETPTEQEAPESTALGNYDTNIIQLSDTELQGVPYEEIVSQYDEGDVDAIVYAGDASKKQGREGATHPAQYLEQFEETYATLSQIQDELNTDVLVEPGNHDPIAGSHTPWGEDTDEEYVEQVENMLNENYEEFSETDQNAYEFLLEEYDLTNIEYDSVDVGNITVVGGTHHDGELDKNFEKEWLEGDTDAEGLDYDSEDLEDIAENLSGGYLSRIVNTISFGLFGSPKKTKDDLGLEEIPDDLKTEGHGAYEEAIELQGYFEDAIESANNDVFLTHHGIPTSFDEDYGSQVVENVMEEYSEDLVGVGGGHTGTAGIEENYGVPTFNTNYGAVFEIGYDNGELSHFDPLVEPESEREGPSRGDLVETLEEMEQVGGPDNYFEEEMEPRIDEMAQQQGLEDDEVDQIKEERRNQFNALWESRDQIRAQQTQEGQEAEV